MRICHSLMLLAVMAMEGCSPAPQSQKFSVFFEPYSAALDQQARSTISSVAEVARTNASLPIAVSGFSAPPDPGLDVNGLSAQRAAAVKQLLIDDGVKPDRIAISASGITDPKTLPNVSVRRVDISLGG